MVKLAELFPDEAQAESLSSKDLPSNRQRGNQQGGYKQGDDELPTGTRPNEQAENPRNILKPRQIFSTPAPTQGSLALEPESTPELPAAEGQIPLDLAAEQDEVSQFIRLISNVVEAHSVSLCVPLSYVLQRDIIDSQLLGGRKLSAESFKKNGQEPYVLLCMHTLSPESAAPAGTVIQGGALLWVARTSKTLHVSPFERNATSLGIYSGAVKLKSVAAIPIKLPTISPQVEEGQYAGVSYSTGILAADSLKSYKFTPLQIKLLTELASSFSRTLQLREERDRLTERLSPSAAMESKFSARTGFVDQARRLAKRVGKKGLAILSLSQSSPRVEPSGKNQAPGSLPELPHFPASINFPEILTELEVQKKAWGAIEEYAESLTGDPSAVFFSGSGKIYCICDHLSLASLRERLGAAYAFVIRRELQPHLSSENSRRARDLEGSLTIQSVPYSEWSSSHDGFINGFANYL